MFEPFPPVLSSFLQLPESFVRFLVHLLPRCRDAAEGECVEEVLDDRQELFLRLLVDLLVDLWEILGGRAGVEG